MKDLKNEDIQKALDDITDVFIGDSEFISVEFTEEDKFIVSTKTGITERLVPRSVIIRNSETNQDERFDVTVEEGVEIVPFFGDVKLHPPLEIRDGTNGQYGGDECRNAKEMGKYGTISFYAGEVNTKMEGACSKTCITKPALASNNHVIARSDAGKPGEQIWTKLNQRPAAETHTAVLKCIVPLKCQSNIDFATATINTNVPVKRWEVRDIGRLNKIKHPKRGQQIRKHGARTGLTSGTVTGISNLSVGSYIYKGVFVTSRGFSCPGDSGSPVVNDANDLVGVLSWGEKIDCSEKPKGYFWAFNYPTRTNAKHESVSTLTIEDSNSVIDN